MVDNLDQAHQLYLRVNRAPSSQTYSQLAKLYPQPSGAIFKKSQILKFYRTHQARLALPPLTELGQSRLLTKPGRTQSGVTPVTVLTKPYPCPGDCLFCPSDIRQPKSYLSTEPGAQRAVAAAFDPYLQTFNRLLAFKDMGHPYQKVELLVLGGTWSVYPSSYRRWFIMRLFDALNDFGHHHDGRAQVKPRLDHLIPPLPFRSGSQPKILLPSVNQTYNQAIKAQYPLSTHPSESATWSQLTRAQKQNQTSLVRCVGLVLETRPDFLTEAEALCLRRLGATKIQLGLQSLNDRVLALNRRGHSVATSAQALARLRTLGFKIHVHWMPNLYGSSVVGDIRDYRRLFSDPRFRPDEIKIYPCSLIPGTELVKLYHRHRWQPYTKAELTEVLTACLKITPRYCRLSRMIRDIGSQDILAGNKLTNFRQIAESAVVKKGSLIQDIRYREIRHHPVKSADLKLRTTRYLTAISQEFFIEFVTPTDQIAAFLRLSLPQPKASNFTLPELRYSALLREVHVYGPALNLHLKKPNLAQHTGLGTHLIHLAAARARRAGFHRLSVISAIGTRPYYQRLGFSQGQLYQHLALN